MSCLVWAKYLVLVLVAIILHAHHHHCCIEQERLALLELKSYFYYMQSFVDPRSNAFFWSDNGERLNCCAWERAQCNPSTGRVTELLLGGMLGYPARPWLHTRLFNVTLFHSFRELMILDLSLNFINGLVESDGSTKISTLKNLRMLNMDENYNFTGYVSMGDLTSLERLSFRDCNLNESSFPLQGLCEVKNLMELDLGKNQFNGGLPSCLQKLSSLKYLDLSNNKLNGEFPKVLSSIRSLEYIDLSNNYFEGKFSLTSLFNLSELHVLRLSNNMLEVGFGDSSWRPTFQLQTLDLRGCNISNTFQYFPAFLSHQTNLSDLDLSNNNLFETFPTWLFNNSKLKALYMTDNHLIGRLQLPHYVNLSLQILDISNNNFHGKLLIENVGLVFPGLQYLNLSGNQFEGPLPASIGDLKEIRFLDLSYNNFSGEIPRSFLRDLKSLEVLELSDNNIEGEIIPDDMNLPRLTWLKLSNNRFGGTIKDALKRSSRLYYFDISNNNVTGKLPWWIGTFSDDLFSMSMSQNNFEGRIPKELFTLALDVVYLDLSQNNLSGPIPSCSNSCGFCYLHLNGNNLSRELPKALTNCSDLKTLALNDNQLSGNIPTWINELSKLTVLLLAGNNLHGPIPHQMCQLTNVNILDLSRNNVHGGIPICFGNMSFGINIKMIYFGSIYSDYSLGDGAELEFYDKPDQVEIMYKNRHSLYMGRILLLMSGLDLSCNKLTGEIPPNLGELNQIQSLNLSHNLLSGSVPSRFSNLKQIESIDLSYNNLSGTIPSQLIELNFLAIFNVSYNNLSGRVPEAGQFANFDESNYMGNPRLYGYQVNEPIKALSPATPIEEAEEIGDHGGIDMVDFLWSFFMSCVTMFLSTVLILYINPQWRGALFEFVDWHVLWWLPIS